MAGSSTKLTMEIFMTTSNAVLNLNPYMPFLIQSLNLIYELGGTIADRCHLIRQLPQGGLGFSHLLAHMPTHSWVKS